MSKTNQSCISQMLMAAGAASCAASSLDGKCELKAGGASSPQLRSSSNNVKNSATMAPKRDDAILITRLCGLISAHAKDFSTATSVDLFSAFNHAEKTEYEYFTRGPKNLEALKNYLVTAYATLIPSWLTLRCVNKEGSYFLRLVLGPNAEYARLCMKKTISDLIRQKVYEPVHTVRQIPPLKGKAKAKAPDKAHAQQVAPPAAPEANRHSFVRGVDIFSLLSTGAREKMHFYTRNAVNLQELKRELEQTVLPSHAALTCKAGPHFMQLIVHPVHLVIR